MSASRTRGQCPSYNGFRYRSETQVRKGRDRTRAEQARAGVPEPLRVAHWYQCPVCRGWHLHANRAASRAYLDSLSVASASAVVQLAAA